MNGLYPRSNMASVALVVKPAFGSAIPRAHLDTAPDASRPRLAAAPNAMARVNRFNAACAVERLRAEEARGPSLGDVLCCGACQDAPNPSRRKDSNAKHAEYAENGTLSRISCFASSGFLFSAISIFAAK